MEQLAGSGVQGDEAALGAGEVSEEGVHCGVAASDPQRRASHLGCEDRMDRLEDGLLTRREFDAVDTAAPREDDRRRSWRVGCRFEGEIADALGEAPGGEDLAGPVPHDQVAARVAVQDLEGAVAVEVGELDAPDVAFRLPPDDVAGGVHTEQAVLSIEARDQVELAVALEIPQRETVRAEGGAPEPPAFRIVGGERVPVAPAVRVAHRARADRRDRLEIGRSGPVAGRLEADPGGLAGRRRARPDAPGADDPQPSRCELDVADRAERFVVEHRPIGDHAQPEGDAELGRADRDLGLRMDAGSRRAARGQSERHERRDGPGAPPHAAVSAGRGAGWSSQPRRVRAARTLRPGQCASV